MATFSLCGMGPAAVAPYCGEILIRQFGFGAFFAAIIMVTAASAFLVSKIPSEQSSHHETPPAFSTDRTRGYRQLLVDSRLLPLWIVTLLFALAISSRLSFVAPFAYQRGVTRVGTYFAIYAVFGMAVRIFTGRLMDSVGLERILVPSMMVLAIGLGLIGATGQVEMLDAAGVVGGASHRWTVRCLRRQRREKSWQT